jgi:hypothetical protein
MSLSATADFSSVSGSPDILLDTMYQNGDNYTKLPLNGRKILYHMTAIYSKYPEYTYTNLFHYKAHKNLPNFFWFENIPSGNPGLFSHSKKVENR